jgi:hypothetical protein
MNDMICVSETCKARSCCEICARSTDQHEHKFYLHESSKFITF